MIDMVYDVEDHSGLTTKQCSKMLDIVLQSIREDEVEVQSRYLYVLHMLLDTFVGDKEKLVLISSPFPCCIFGNWAKSQISFQYFRF